MLTVKGISNKSLMKVKGRWNDDFFFSKIR